MKKLKTCLAFFICCILSLNMVICNVKADNNVVLSNKAYLLKTGMPQKEIEKLDDDVMQFIVDDLKSGGKHFEYINSNIENQISILSSETLTGISFTASAFKNASTIYIYPTYEFTSNKQPRGKDSFSFQLGAAMRPYEYGGKLWYKDNTMNDWKVGGTLTANNQQLSGAEFSGSQLGTPDYAMKLKGVTYCHATACPPVSRPTNGNRTGARSVQYFSSPFHKSCVPLAVASSIICAPCGSTVRRRYSF